MSLRSLAGCNRALIAAATLLAISAGFAAMRPRYGGTLRVMMREAVETPDPPQTGAGLADLTASFAINRWEAGAHALFAADENAAGGRPYLDRVEVRMGQSLHDQSIALDTGRADLVELGAAELRRQPAGREIWSSAPVRIIALVFGARLEDARVREALALAADRTAIHNVLLPHNAEISGALLPQWLSGYAFLFPAAQDLAKAKSLLAGVGGSLKTLSMSVDDPTLRPIADRIALDARYAGLTVTVSSQNPNPDVRLVDARVRSSDPARVLAGLASAFGLPAPSTGADLYAAERALLEGFRVAPLFHVPLIYGVNSRVKGGPGITPLGEWHFENLWLEGGRP